MAPEGFPTKAETDSQEESNLPEGYSDQVDAYVSTHAKADELPKWGEKTQFEAAMEDLNNLADGNWDSDSIIDAGTPLSAVAEHYHKGWTQEDFAKLRDDIVEKTTEESETDAE